MSFILIAHVLLSFKFYMIFKRSLIHVDIYQHQYHYSLNAKKYELLCIFPFSQNYQYHAFSGWDRPDKNNSHYCFVNYKHM
jgi:hypothetical protein